jgi:TolB-like protein/DNA-binding winged helix-turn-helix (wHTH) protein
MSSLTSNLYRFGEFQLDPQSRVLTRGGTALPLTPKAFDVLLLLIQNAGKIVTKDELMKAVWPNSFVEESNLTQTIFMVRKALDEASGRRYILNVQGQGYRFLVPVTETASELETESPVLVPAVPVAPETPLQSQPRPNPWRLAVLAMVAAGAVLIAGAATWLWRSRHAPAQPQGKIMLAVLPFENFTGDPGQDYFSDGLTEEMISQLGNLDPASLGVIARTSIMRYKHTTESIPRIGEDLGVQYVIEGSVRRDSERVRITAQLIQVKDQSHLWAREYDRDLGHLLELQEEIAREAANEIEFSLSGRRPIEPASERSSPAAKSRANSYEVYDLCLKGRYFWNKRTGEGFRQAANYFQQAIDKDPNYGAAYAGLADTFGLMSTWYEGPQNELMPKARTAALRALELDESLAEAHASLALIKENYDYDWPGAEREFRRAIQLNPQYATAHQWYAESLSWQGRFQEAFAESEQARRLDPLSPIIGSDYASILYYSHQYDAALKQIRSVLELDPNFEHAQGEMVPSYLQLGKYGEAIDAINHWPKHEGGLWVWAWKAAVYGRSGRADEAHRALAKLEQAPASLPGLPAILLVAYSGTGQKERVLDVLEKAYSEHSNAVMQIKVDPIYDPIRANPRFQDLLRRIGLQR